MDYLVLITRRPSDWAYDERNKKIVCCHCHAPIDLSVANLADWLDRCENCRKEKRWTLVGSLVMGLLIIFIALSIGEIL